MQEPQWAGEAYTREFVMERLQQWGSVLRDLRLEATNVVMPRAEIVRTCDRWLDELNDLTGR